VRVAPTGIGIVLERVQWRLKPGRLANGEVAFDTTVSTGGVVATMEIARDGSRWHVRDLTANGDAGAFASVFPILGTYRFTGPITASSAALDGDGRERLRRPSRRVARCGNRPLGRASAGKLSRRLALGGGHRPRCRDDARRCTARRRHRDDHSAGASRVQRRGARPRAAPAAALEPLLDLIGPRKPNGARAIEIRLQ
jgi:hypothetical protein